MPNPANKRHAVLPVRTMNSYYTQVPHKIFPVCLRYGIIHVHIPKTAGTSIRSALFGSSVIKHVTATQIERELWEALPSFSIVRHPLHRFLSNYRYHCRSNYSGVLLKSYPDLKSLDVVQYCDRLLERHPLLLPQARFVTRDDSAKTRVDHILQFETLSETLPALLAQLGIKKRIRHLKRGPETTVDLPEATRRRVEAFYEEDFALFGY